MNLSSTTNSHPCGPLICGDVTDVVVRPQVLPKGSTRPSADIHTPSTSSSTGPLAVAPATSSVGRRKAVPTSGRSCMSAASLKVVTAPSNLCSTWRGGEDAVAVVDDRGRAGINDVPPPTEDFGRQPPQDEAAEQAVLGGMLLSKDAIADVLERLRPGDFSRPNHQSVYDAVLDLYGRGEPADAVTVAAELDRRGLLRRIGGAPYLHTLISTVPTAANAGYYAGIVAEKALLRRLVEAGTRVVQYGYAGAEGADVAEVVDRAQAEIYDVTDGRTSEDFVALEDLLQPTMDEIDAIASQGGISRGVPTGFLELDEVTNGLHPGQMIVIAARPGVGKATLGLDFLRSCSIKNRMSSVIFSLEMSKSEIVMRLLSAEAKIKLADMRSGRMSDDDW